MVKLAGRFPIPTIDSFIELLGVDISLMNELDKLIFSNLNIRPFSVFLMFGVVKTDVTYILLPTSIPVIRVTESFHKHIGKL